MTRFDGVLCSAVLMHLPEELIFDSLYSIRRMLKENGRLLISVPNGLPFEGNRDKHGRLLMGFPVTGYLIKNQYLFK